MEDAARWELSGSLSTSPFSYLTKSVKNTKLYNTSLVGNSILAARRGLYHNRMESGTT